MHKIKRTLLFVLSSVSLHVNAGDAPLCYDLFKKINSAPDRHLNELSPEIETFIRSIDQMLGPMKPKDTHIDLSSILGLQESYNKHTEWLIVIGFYKTSYELTTSVKAIIAHEYGHASLYEYIKSNHPNFNLDQARPLLRAYNELYADLVSALYFDDPQIMYTNFILPYKKPSAANNIKQTRDFNLTPNLTSWTEAQHGPAIHDTYIQFDPIRGWLWQFIKAHHIAREKYPQILQAYIEASVQHLKIRLTQGEPTSNKADPQQINNEFYHLLSNALQQQF